MNLLAKYNGTLLYDGTLLKGPHLADDCCPLHRAAPELLEALKRVAMSPELNCDHAHGRGCDCVGDAVRAVIAKAEKGE